MRLNPVSDYDAWRLEAWSTDLLREGLNPPPEWLLQRVWLHQRLKREGLRCQDDDRRLVVLHPGFWNHDAGPDFLGAMIQWDGDEPKSGDVEIDLHPSNWSSHGHEDNPNFRQVMLQVVWNAPVKTKHRNLPVLEIGSLLDAPIEELHSTLSGELEFPEALKGQCASPLTHLNSDQWQALLREAAAVRFNNKAWRIQARARQVGWNQSLWEGLFRALGYKQNVWPFQRLAELLPELSLVERRGVESTNPTPESVISIQALLHGLSGLLPEEWDRTQDPLNNSYVRKLWDVWWREANRFRGIKIPKGLWRLDGVRPANFPSRRLALAAYWLQDKDWIQRLQDWFLKEDGIERSVQRLSQVMHVPSDPYWSFHWNFQTATLDRPLPLIGPPRMSDLAVNVILPWFYARANVEHRSKEQQLANTLYFHWPASEDNAVLRLTRQRLFGDSPQRPTVKKAFEQQGLMQIVQDFCAQSDSICTDCRFPDLVKHWKG